MSSSLEDRMVDVAGEDSTGAHHGKDAHASLPFWLASALDIPPTRALRRPRLVTAPMITSSSGRGESGTRTSVAS